MKNLIPVLLTVFIAFSCIKEQTNVPTPVSKDKPVVKTDSAGSVAFTSAKIYSTIVSEGASAVTAAGIAWGISENPTVFINNIPATGFGVGSFSTTIPGLSEGITYYVRTYATNGVGTTYSEQIQFTTKTSQLPEVITLEPTQIGNLSFTLNGEVKSIGTSPVTERGFEYAISSNFANKTTVAVGSGLGIFSKEISGLNAGTQYYVRAYAINDEGNKPGEVKTFNTPFLDGDGNIYKSVVIGSQVWLTENLKTTKYLNGDLIAKTNDSNIWQNSTQGMYYDVNRQTGYGQLYNSLAFKDPKKLCPSGTHVPSNVEWLTLLNFLGDSTSAAVKLKTNSGWKIDSINYNGSNSSGFSALPAGFFSTSVFGTEVNNEGNLSFFWATASGASFPDGLTGAVISSYLSVLTKGLTTEFEYKPGISIRCIKD